MIDVDDVGRIAFHSAAPDSLLVAAHAASVFLRPADAQAATARGSVGAWATWQPCVARAEVLYLAASDRFVGRAWSSGRATPPRVGPRPGYAPVP